MLLIKLTEDPSPLALLWRKSADADKGKSLVGRLFLRVVYTVIVVFSRIHHPPFLVYRTIVLVFI